jgi:hypothetical protein
MENNLLAPEYKPKNFSFADKQLENNPLAPGIPKDTINHPLAPDRRTEITPEEREVLRVGLFVDILDHEFREHKGYSCSDWRSLYKYWVKHIAKAEFWSARKEMKKIDVGRLVKEGVLTVETQKRLYGDECWFNDDTENEREKTIEWLQTLAPDDVQYTLYSYFEGGLREFRAKIKNENQPKAKSPPPKPKKENPVIIRERLYLETVLKMYKDSIGYHSTNPADLSKAAIKFKNNKALESEFIRHLRSNSKNLALAPDDDVSNMAKSHVYTFKIYDEEDFEISFEYYFYAKNKEKLQTRSASGPIAKPELLRTKSKTNWIKLKPSYIKALSTESKYQDIPKEFDNQSLVKTQMKYILKYLHEFYEQKKDCFYYNSEDFINFCIRNSYPAMTKDFGPRTVSMSESSMKKSSTDNFKDLDTKKELVPISENEIRSYINTFSTPNMTFIRLHLIYTEVYGYPANQGKPLYELWEKIQPIDRSKFGLWIFKFEATSLLMSPKADEERKNACVGVLDGFYQRIKNTKIEKIKEINDKKIADAKKLKEKYSNVKKNPPAESKKDRWALGNKLLEIQKRFPLDPIVKKMVKNEFTEKPLKKYDLEYETHNQDDELRRKQGKVALEPTKYQKSSHLGLEDLVKLEYRKLQYIEEHSKKTEDQIKEENTKQQEKPMFKAIKKLATTYLESKQSSNLPVSLYLSNSYMSLKAQFPLAVSRHFPYKNYGSTTKANGEKTFGKSYPQEFKHYFFAVFKSLLKTAKGIIMLKSMPALIWAPPSKSKCTIHADVCPPNCMYVTLNKKIIRQTMKNEEYSVAWHSKLRPWFRPDMQKDKEKVFMNLSDARECRFEPVVGSKVPEKHLALTFKHFSEIRNKINPDQAPNFNMWVSRLGNNLKSSDPSLFKTGIYKQAKALYIQDKYKESKDLLVEHFNMPCILDHFMPGKSRPNINEKPLEDFNNPSNLELMTEVFNLHCAIKSQFYQARKQLETIKKLEEADLKSKKTHTIKKEMCHDPNCDKSNCGKAHNPFEIRFGQENKIRNNYKLKLKEKIKSFQPAKKTPWMPTGTLVDCVNCHSNFLYKPQKPKTASPDKSKKTKKPTVLRDPETVVWSRSKCCNKCSLEQRLKENQNRFLENFNN